MFLPTLCPLSVHISTLCVGERTYPQYKVIHGAVLSSESENDLDCVITFQTDSILQKFMLRFEKLALDCNDHLTIFDGAHAISKKKVRKNKYAPVFLSLKPLPDIGV